MKQSGQVHRKAPHIGPTGTSKRVLAIASRGGHWEQLLRIQAGLAGHDVAYASTTDHRSDVPGRRFYRIHDASRRNKFGLLLMAYQVLRILLRERPQVVITTGAAPGYFALRLGKGLGARTLWLDSIANAEELSLSGQRAGRFADLWLTQWPHLARPEGPTYRGEVL